MALFKHTLYVFIFILYQPSSYASWAEKTLQSLSLDEKIGQLFMVPVRIKNDLDVLTHNTDMPSYMTASYVDFLITEYHVGGIIYLGQHTALQQFTLTQHFQSHSQLPLLIGQDFECGLGMRLTDCISFPRAMTLGAAHEPKLIYQMAKEIGNQCRALGVHVNFAPVVDINTNPKNPIIGLRSFSDNPLKVTELACAFSEGLLDAGILPCIKHFPGHGDSYIDSHYDIPIISHQKERLESIELTPFNTLISNGIPAIMTAHLCVPALDPTGTPASLSRIIVTDLLRNACTIKNIFDGIIITDALDMGALITHISAADRALEAFKAGNDILLAPSDVPGAHSRIKKIIETGIITHEELDNHVLRILKAKEWIFYTNLHDRIIPSLAHNQLHTQTSYDLQKTLYEKACTLLYSAHTISIKNQKTFITSIGTYDPSPFINTIQQASTDISYIPLEQALTSCTNTTLIITLFAEGNYVSILPPASYNAIMDLINAGNTCIVVLFGTPYLIPLLPKTHTLLVAYEPVPPAQQAAAQILLGAAPASGVLPVSIDG